MHRICSGSINEVNDVRIINRTDFYATAFLAGFCFAQHAMPAQPSELSGKEAAMVAVFAPRPAYPYEARQKHQTGSGIVALTIDPTTGNVIKAEMKVSTGHEMLDNSARSALGNWRFKPGVISKATMPIEFRLSGEVRIIEQARPMDEVLAPFLGRGDVVKAPLPHYPTTPAWIRKGGNGVYEIHVDNGGAVTRVRILRSSRDEIFDKVVVQTLRKWRLRKGPKVIELPLAFTLTPNSFHVRIP